MRDADVRSAMLKRLRDLHNGDSSTRIVEEMGIWSGTVRIDIAVINGHLSGIELKSDRDTLERLPNQAALYSRVFDNMTLVVGQRHAEKSMPLIPDWWSVICATSRDGELVLEDVRVGRQNPEQDPFLLAQLLWKDEAIELLDRLGSARGWRSKTAAAVHQRLTEVLTLKELGIVVRQVLKERGQWLGQSVAN